MVSPQIHLKWNSLANIAILTCMIFAMCLKTWGSINGLEFSLRELNLKENGGWVETGRFKKMCTNYNIQKFPDIKNDCEMIGNFEMGGILVRTIQYILFAVFAMGIQCYNILSALVSSFEVPIEVLELEFPHMLSPISYSVALLLYLSTIGAVFMDFSPGFAFWLTLCNNLATYIVAVHYKANKNLIKN